KVFVKNFDTEKFANKNNVSIQMAARQLRYTWFEKLRKEQNCDLIATAHHANDNAETLLMNLAKGTGISGIKGILPKKSVLIRPFLCFTRAELQQFAEKNKIDYREDASNASTKYERNYVRHEIVAKFENQYPDFVEKMNAFAFKMQDAEAIYRTGLERILKKLIEHRLEAQFVSILKLKSYTYWKTLLYEWLSPYGFKENHLPEIEKLLNAPPGKEIKNEAYRILKDRKFLILCANTNEGRGLVAVSENQKAVSVGNVHFTFKKADRTKININDKSAYAFLDCDKLHFPLVIRPWKKGDYFYPLGMNKKKKKVSNFFQDKKLNALEKENILLLFSGEKLVWVCGHRIDERFNIGAGTKRVLNVRVKEK
ncbi:MAG: tRNA lysidine(34) synthetase TilS, partial [Chitinophagales bacterium]